MNVAGSYHDHTQRFRIGAVAQAVGGGTLFVKTRGIDSISYFSLGVGVGKAGIPDQQCCQFCAVFVEFSSQFQQAVQSLFFRELLLSGCNNGAV